MFKYLLNDPNFLPITIIFIALVLVAIWQKLDRFFIPLALVYSLYVIITIVMSPDQKSQFELPMKEIVKVPVDTLNKVINKKESEWLKETHKCLKCKMFKATDAQLQKKKVLESTGKLDSREKCIFPRKV